MALYAIGDLHLSLSGNKSMEVFGESWKNYVARLESSFSALTENDTLVLTGDTSWGMSLQEAEADFRFLDRFPCHKLLVKGNHDFWWTTVSKMKRFLEAAEIRTLDFLHNNCAFYGPYALCGTRGWFSEESQKPHDAKVLNRELLRLETSLKAAEGKPILCFLHYPPLYRGYECPEILNLLDQYHVKCCYYGHLHGPTISRAVNEVRGGTEYFLISADYLSFVPKKICE
jgi:predicted phosphohydrolase